MHNPGNPRLSLAHQQVITVKSSKKKSALRIREGSKVRRKMKAVPDHEEKTREVVDHSEV